MRFSYCQTSHLVIRGTVKEFFFITITIAIFCTEFNDKIFQL